MMFKKPSYTFVARRMTCEQKLYLSVKKRDRFAELTSTKRSDTKCSFSKLNILYLIKRFWTELHISNSKIILARAKNGTRDI